MNMSTNLKKEKKKKWVGNQETWQKREKITNYPKKMENQKPNRTQL